MVDSYGRLVRMGVIQTKNSESTLASAAVIRNALLQIRSEFCGVESSNNVEFDVAVEDYLRMFMQRSSAKTLFALAEMNALVRYDCQTIFGGKSVTPPLSVHPNQARGLFGLRAPRVKKAKNTAVQENDQQEVDDDADHGSDQCDDTDEKVNIKEIVFDFVEEVLRHQYPHSSIPNDSSPSPSFSDCELDSSSSGSNVKSKSKKSITTTTLPFPVSPDPLVQACMSRPAHVRWLLDRRRASIHKLSFDMADSALIAWTAMHQHAIKRASADERMRRAFAEMIRIELSLPPISAPAATEVDASQKKKKKSSSAESVSQSAEASDSSSADEALRTVTDLWNRRLEKLSPRALLFRS